MIKPNASFEYDNDTVLLELNEKWKFSLSFGWVPITDDEPDQAFEIYQAEDFELKIDDLVQVLKSKFKLDFIYEINEHQKVSIRKIEECDFCYTGLEHLYTDQSYQFAIYFSHESSVTIGGDQLITEVHGFWPEYINHFWKPFWE